MMRTRSTRADFRNLPGGAPHSSIVQGFTIVSTLMLCAVLAPACGLDVQGTGPDPVPPGAPRPSGDGGAASSGPAATPDRGSATSDAGPSTTPPPAPDAGCAVTCNGACAADCSQCPAGNVNERGTCGCGGPQNCPNPADVCVAGVCTACGGEETNGAACKVGVCQSDTGTCGGGGGGG